MRKAARKNPVSLRGEKISIQIPGSICVYTGGAACRGVRSTTNVMLRRVSVQTLHGPSSTGDSATKQMSGHSCDLNISGTS